MSALPNSWPHTPTQRCLQIIAREGLGSVKWFLADRHPELGNVLGATILEYEPERLLEYLLNKYDAPLNQVQTRLKCEVENVLAILDELAATTNTSNQ
jgi:hypothetical protein